MKNLTHTDKQGKAIMIDIGEKPVQTRIARAAGHISVAPATLDLIRENQLKKGDVLTLAQVAGINAAKETSHLIPLCHNIVLDSIKVQLSVGKNGVTAVSEVKCNGKTGVEMEALTAVSVALLTVYDMCKAVDKEMAIDKIELTEKIKL
jgi:cyclic pyranopterin phosphate synthase